MRSPSTIFQASDLNQRGRAIIDAAREGEARVRDKDGFSLVMLPEERVRALETIAASVANLASIERALAHAPDRVPDLPGFGAWTWLRAFDVEDLREFVQEVRDALLVAAREETVGILDEVLRRWRTTAQALEDPLCRQILLGQHQPGDFVDVQRPE